MIEMPKFIRVLLLFSCFIPISSIAQDSQPLRGAIESLREAGKIGAGFDQAMVAATELRQIPIDRLTLLLDAMADANPIAENWIRGVVFDVVRRADSVPLAMLTTYAMDEANNPTGRGLAMELIRNQSPTTAESLIAKCLNDPSLPLREMAVQQQIDAAKAVEKDEPEQAKAVYAVVLVAARHPQQLETIVDSLRKLGDEQVSIGSAFAMIPTWKSVAPFDNVGGVGFNTEYPPESEFVKDGKVDLDAAYPGKSGPIKWQEVAAVGDKGVVDLAAAYDKEKGAVSYLYTEFESSETRPAQLRLGCINANKVWLNGEPVMANEVYHAGSMIDQYIANVELKQGTNRVLLKICQNEQTESWAQEWEFQFRVTDPTGKALRSGD
jgi:hypothetical protein